MNKFGLLLVIAASVSFAQDATLQSQQIQLPPKPTCVAILANSSCADLWRQYNAAVLQQYVVRQKEAASAPLQQQIAELNKLVAEQQAQLKIQQEQMQASSAGALQSTADARIQWMQQGASYGAAGILVLFGLIYAARRMTAGYTIPKKEQARAASA